MSDFYSAVIFLSVFIMIIMDMLVSGNDLMEHDKKQTIYTVSVLVIAGAVSEWLGVWMDGADPSLRTLHILVKTIELSTAPIITVLCSDLMTPLKHKKLIYSLLFANALLEICSAFTGFIFSVDAQNVYHHEAFYWIYVLTYSGGVLLFLLMLLRESGKYYGMHRTTVVMLPGFFLCGLLIQYQASVRVTWLCTAVDILLVYILYSELTQKTDVLTHLLNRRSYESRLASLREHAVIYYFDVDEFKSVNDTFGHGVGDAVLAEVGSTIYAVFSKVGYCYRIGGDEFCVIAQISDMAAEKYLSEFLRELTARRVKNEHLPHVSVGYACFNPVLGSVEDAIKRADRMMYHYKRKLKETSAAK